MCWDALRAVGWEPRSSPEPKPSLGALALGRTTFVPVRPHCLHRQPHLIPSALGIQSLHGWGVWQTLLGEENERSGSGEEAWLIVLGDGKGLLGAQLRAEEEIRASVSNLHAVLEPSQLVPRL